MPTRIKIPADSGIVARRDGSRFLHVDLGHYRADLDVSDDNVIESDEFAAFIRENPHPTWSNDFEVID